MLLVKNRTALRNYEIVHKYEAGVVLLGYEVKSIKERNVSFEGAYIKFIEGVPTIDNLHIGRYSKQSQDFGSIDTKRPRKLLLRKDEIHKLAREISEKGKTAVPLALVLNHNMIKLEFAVVKGRKKHDIKQLEKERQIQKDMEKEVKLARG